MRRPATVLSTGTYGALSAVLCVALCTCDSTISRAPEQVTAKHEVADAFEGSWLARLRGVWDVTETLPDGTVVKGSDDCRWDPTAEAQLVCRFRGMVGKATRMTAYFAYSWDAEQGHYALTSQTSFSELPSPGTAHLAGDHIELRWSNPDGSTVLGERIPRGSGFRIVAYKTLPDGTRRKTTEGLMTPREKPAR